MAQIDKLNTLLPNNSQSLNEYLLEAAKFAILNKQYPFKNYPTTTTDGVTTIDEVEDRYLNLELRIAVELDSKRGGEGETIHIENGIERTYEKSNVSPSLLAEVTPVCEPV